MRLAVLLVALSATFPLSSLGGRAEAGLPDPPPELMTDADGDKIFDNLERRLQGAADSARFDVLVQFERPPESVDFRGLRRNIGPLQQSAPVAACATCD